MSIVTTESSRRPSPPVAERRPLPRVHHGDTFDDPYEWLRAKDDPAVIAHLEAENAYTRNGPRLSRAPRADLLRDQGAHAGDRPVGPDASGRLVVLLAHGRGAAVRDPLPRTDRRRRGLDAPRARTGNRCAGEQILLDANVEAEGHDFSPWVPSTPRVTARCCSTASTTRATSATRCACATSRPGRPFPTSSRGRSRAPVSLPDGRFVVYTTVDDAWRPDTVWLHELGTPLETDTRLFHEPDERFWVDAGFTRSERYLVIGVGSSVTSEEWLLDADDLRVPRASSGRGAKGSSTTRPTPS